MSSVPAEAPALQDFSANLMGLRGGFCLGDALRTNGKLVRVDLSGCGFGDEGGMALVAGLDAAVSMKWLGLRQNRLGLKTAEHLSEVLQVLDTPFCRVVPTPALSRFRVFPQNRAIQCRTS